MIEAVGITIGSSSWSIKWELENVLKSLKEIVPYELRHCVNGLKTELENFSKELDKLKDQERKDKDNG